MQPGNPMTEKVVLNSVGFGFGVGGFTAVFATFPDQPVMWLLAAVAGIAAAVVGAILAGVPYRLSMKGR